MEGSRLDIKKTFGFCLILVIFILLPFEILAEYDTSQQEILIGLIPEQNIFKQMDRYRPLASYISEKTGVKIKLTVLSRYGDVVERFISRGMDGAFFDALTGTMAITKLNVHPVVRPVNLDNTSTVRSYIFARTDSNIKSVKDMKGKRAVFVDRATATGYLFAVAFLQENGISDIDRFFSEYFFTGSHDSAIYSVLDNRADVGSAQSTIFNMLILKDPTIKRELRIIAESEEFPETTLCLRRDISLSVRNKITEALLNMNHDSEGRETLKKFGALRFIGAGEHDFAPIINLAKRANVDIKGYKGKR